MVKAQSAKSEYSMRDADTLEDSLVLMILKKMNCVYAGRFMKLTEVFSLPALIFILVAVTVYVLSNKLGLYILLVPAGLLAIYIPNTVSSFKMRRQNSGIKHDIKKCGEHFLIAYATCTGKNERTSFLGRRYYSLTARLRDGKSLQSIPVFEPYYNNIKVGKEFALIMSSSKFAEELFAIPKNVMQPSSKTKKAEASQTEPIIENLLRPLGEADRKIALEFGIYRNKLRIKYYGKAYLICSVLSVAFFAISLFFNSDYINLSIVVLCCLAAAIVMHLIEWHQYKKMIIDNSDKLACLDAKVALKKADLEKKGKYIELEDLSGKRVYHSTATEDYKTFERGNCVLLIYQDGKNKPIICMKSLPAI